MTKILLHRKAKPDFLIKKECGCVEIYLDRYSYSIYKKTINCITHRSKND